MWAGHYADTRGAKRAMVTGLLAAAAAGLFYLLSLRFVDVPGLSATVLVLGRGVLGASESFVITGALGWGLALGGPQNAGRVMAWMGMPMYAAFALGAPMGSALYAAYGFTAITVATTLAPLAGLALIAPLRSVLPSGQPRPAFANVFAAVRVPGLGLALSSMGFGSVTIFVALLFAQRGWSGAWGAFTALSVTFILARLLLGHLPDRIGGAKVALLSVLAEGAGQALIWLAPTTAAVFAGAALTGLGYSLVYPALGVEAVRRAPPESRALVMGAYTACLDLALGLAGPGFGLIASSQGLGAVFLASTLLVLSAAAVAIKLMSTPRNNPPWGSPY
jgi:MFS family permease